MSGRGAVTQAFAASRGACGTRYSVLRTQYSVRRAYTLFELVLVLALIVVIATLVYPSLDAMYSAFRAQEAADTVRATWATARAHAVNEGRPYRFAVVPGKGNFRIAPDSADFWAGGEMPAAADLATPPFVVEDALPRGVRFMAPEAFRLGAEPSGDTILPPGSVEPTMWANTAVFLPDGTARDDVEILFHSAGARPLLLRLRALTGIVTVRPYVGQGVRP